MKKVKMIYDKVMSLNVMNVVIFSRILSLFELIFCHRELRVVVVDMQIEVLNDSLWDFWCYKKERLHVAGFCLCADIDEMQSIHKVNSAAVKRREKSWR